MSNRTTRTKMNNAYITGGEGVVKVNLIPNVSAIGEGSTDEYELRKSFLDQCSYYAGKKAPGEVIGVIKGNAAMATLFDGGTAIVYFWKSKKHLTVRWTRV